MEAAAWLAGRPHSDAPECVCPVIRSFVIGWNDAIPDEARRTAILKPFLLKILDTKSTPAIELKRSYLAFDWLVRVQTPAWLDLSPNLQAHAIALRELAAITDQATIDAAAPKVAAARAAAWDAVGAAAGAAAWDVARAAARAAAWVAAGVAAWDALAPTVALLQASAADLLTRMIAVTEATDAAF
jgi:hypothetical protein